MKALSLVQLFSIESCGKSVKNLCNAQPWVQSFFQGMEFVQRMLTTVKLPTPDKARKEIESVFMRKLFKVSYTSSSGSKYRYQPSRKYVSVGCSTLPLEKKRSP